MILSFGPNKAREFSWGDPAIFGLAQPTNAGLRFVHHTSNGLTSSGDIIAVRGGPIN